MGIFTATLKDSHYGPCLEQEVGEEIDAQGNLEICPRSCIWIKGKVGVQTFSVGLQRLMFLILVIIGKTLV